MSENLVPEPQASVFDSVAKALDNDEDAARRVMLNPNLAKGFKDGKPVEVERKETRGRMPADAVTMPELAAVKTGRMTGSR